MVDMTTETPIPLSDALRLIPPARGGKKTHMSTILRWIKQGLRGPDGNLVRLGAIRLGGRWMISREELQRFGLRLTPPMDSQDSSAPRSLGGRKRAAEKAEAELEAIGI